MSMVFSTLTQTVVFVVVGYWGAIHKGLRAGPHLAAVGPATVGQPAGHLQLGADGQNVAGQPGHLLRGQAVESKMVLHPGIVNTVRTINCIRKRSVWEMQKCVGLDRLKFSFLTSSIVK